MRFFGLLYFSNKTYVHILYIFDRQVGFINHKKYASYLVHIHKYYNKKYRTKLKTGNSRRKRSVESSNEDLSDEILASSFNNYVVNLMSPNISKNSQVDDVTATSSGLKKKLKYLI